MSKNDRSASRRFPAWLWIFVIAAVLIVVAVVAHYTAPTSDDPSPSDPTSTTQKPLPTQPNITMEDIHDVDMPLQKGLVVTDIGCYSGLYMEDGKDEYVTRILMIIVTNNSDQTLQYAQIQLTDGEKTANFSLSTLPPGESVVVLESGRMSYEEGKELTDATIQNAVMFSTEPTLCEDKIKIQALDGVLNITNISGGDISGDVVIYYKHAARDLLYGGITYRVTITGGLKKDEIRQITAGHFTTSGSRVMWVTCGE